MLRLAVIMLTMLYLAPHTATEFHNKIPI